MAIIREDLRLVAGQLYPAPNDVAEWEWRSGDEDEDGEVPLVDLTGYSATMKIRAYAASPTALLTLASGAGITLGGTAGTIALELTAAETEGLGAGTYVYDLVLTPPAGAAAKFVFLAGSMKVEAMISRT